MGFFDFFKIPDINQGVNDYKQTQGALLIDVRTPEEYREGTIPGSKNVPLQTLSSINKYTAKKDTPLFVYCYSGSRSMQAVNILKRMGYTNVNNIGGIASYSGKMS